MLSLMFWFQSSTTLARLIRLALEYVDLWLAAGFYVLRRICTELLISLLGLYWVSDWGPKFGWITMPPVPQSPNGPLVRQWVVKMSLLLPSERETAVASSPVVS